MMDCINLGRASRAEESGGLNGIVSFFCAHRSPEQVTNLRVTPVKEIEHRRASETLKFDCCIIGRVEMAMA